MKFINDNFFTRLVLVLSISGLSSLAVAAGMVPETSVVQVDAGDGEGSINVTNTDNEAMLLYTNLENLPEDTEELLIVTAPITRVEAGEKQLVRFIFQSDKPLTTQRMKRVIFEGIPQKDPNSTAKIKMTVRQNLPVIINPAGLPVKNDPWTLLKWTVSGNTLTVKNDSQYVVRLNQQLDISPGDIKLSLPRTYILPGQTNNLQIPSGKTLGKDAKVRLYPASLYGYEGAIFDAPVTSVATQKPASAKQ